MAGSKPRAIIEDPIFQQQRDELITAPMFDEIMLGVGWALARDPRHFEDPRTPGLGVVTTNRFSSHQMQFRIAFTFDVERVFLRRIERIDDNGN